MLKDLLSTCFNREWKNDITHKPKLRFYLQFKRDKGTELYVRYNLSSIERSYMAQLRLGILPIAVETGRYRGIPINERLCELCNRDCIEDENHILFTCPIYDRLRSAWLEDLDINAEEINNFDKEPLFIKMFQEKPRQTAKYIINIMNCRRNILFE